VRELARRLTPIRLEQQHDRNQPVGTHGYKLIRER
jgi:hypothetical protein